MGFGEGLAEPSNQIHLPQLQTTVKKILCSGKCTKHLLQTPYLPLTKYFPKLCNRLLAWTGKESRNGEGSSRAWPMRCCNWSSIRLMSNASTSKSTLQLKVFLDNKMADIHS